MSKNNDNEQPNQAVELDLNTASNTAFHEAIARFYEWSATQPPPGPLSIESGWHTVAGAVTQDFLRRNVCNRVPSLAPVKKYWYSMYTNDWHKTGQGLVFNVEGKMNEGQQRCWASYFGNVAFDTYIVTDAPVEPDLFAYYDDVDRRTEGDALHTSGLNGFANHLATASHLSYRYEHDALGVLKQPKIHKLNTREVLRYARSHPSLTESADIVFSNYPKAVSLIGPKGVAIFFAERIRALYGQDVLDRFLISLGSGANLEEDSPILGLRNRLFEAKQDKISKERCLALMIKAFRLFLSDKKLGRNGLFVRDNEKFPSLEPATEPQGE